MIGALRRRAVASALRGFVDQEAPQAHAQEEAQEDAPPHAPPAPQQVAPRRLRRSCPDRPITLPGGRCASRPRTPPEGRRPGRDAHPRRTTCCRYRPEPGPRPRATGCVRASPPAPERRPVRRGSRSFCPRPLGPPRSSHARYTAAVETDNGGVIRVNERSTKARGVTRSPMPRTRARPPTRQNGTSAPRRAATSEVVDAGPPQYRRRVGRAPSQAGAGGDLLLDVHARRPPDQRERAADQIRVVHRHAAAVRSADGQPVAVGEGERVGQARGSPSRRPARGSRRRGRP